MNNVKFKVGLFLLFTIFIFIFNTYMLQLLNDYGNLPNHICVFNEELFRLFSILLGPPYWLFTLILSVFEFFIYLINHLEVFNEKEKLAFIFMRIINIGSHFFFLYIQYKYLIKYKKSKDRKFLFKGFTLAFLCHTIWNKYIAFPIFIFILEIVA